jgi:hypothetical protein
MKKRFLGKIPVRFADENIILSAKQLKESQMKYIISKQNIDSEILLLNFFDVESIINGGFTPKYRVFLTVEDYITQSFDEHKVKWLTGSISSVIDNRPPRKL